MQVDRVHPHVLFTGFSGEWFHSLLFGAKPQRHPSIPPKLPETLKNKEAVDELQDEMKKSLGQADVQD